MIHVAILSSSRADFGIYEPLISALANEKKIKSEIIVFGTHISKEFGNTIQEIEKTGIKINSSFNTAPLSDRPSGITDSMVSTMKNLNSVWEKSKFDLVIALGDRYEMFAAVASGLPYNIKFAHIHGGETTLGAIDNALRHSITHMSVLHFTSSEVYKHRVIELKGEEKGVFNTGALSIDKLSTINFLTKEEINKQFSIDIDLPTFLITIHPETIEYENNKAYAKELLSSLSEFPAYQQVFTMPNADTNGQIIRGLLMEYATNHSNVKLIESFGSKAYLSVMKHAAVVIGNSSSGFIEAAWFPKWVVNIGNRQAGRIRTPNIVDVPFNKIDISSAVNRVLTSDLPKVPDIYGNGTAASQIIKHIIDECNTN